MKTFIVTKGGKEMTFQGADADDLMRRLYAAGEGPSAALSPVESVILTDRLMVLEGKDDADVFSWTEDITGEHIKKWAETGSAKVSFAS